MGLDGGARLWKGNIFFAKGKITILRMHHLLQNKTKILRMQTNSSTSDRGHAAAAHSQVWRERGGGRQGRAQSSAAHTGVGFGFRARSLERAFHPKRPAAVFRIREREKKKRQIGEHRLNLSRS